jgi:hypothetical protein
VAACTPKISVPLRMLRGQEAGSGADIVKNPAGVLQTEAVTYNLSDGWDVRTEMP